MTTRSVVLSAASAALLFSSQVASAQGPNTGAVVQGGTVIASGLNNPRGLTFGPDGTLYVAEGGLGGTQTTTSDQCQQVPGPPGPGPYSGGFTARIVKIDSSGNITPVVEGLPSDETSAEAGSAMSGVADVAFVDGTLYALIAGAGCSHGLINTANEIVRVNGDGTVTPIANLSAFLMSHPVANPEPDDFEPDGTWYSMVAVRGDLYAVEPNHGEIDRINPQTGEVTRLVDVSASFGHIVPTSIAYKGNFFVGNLGEFPINPGSQSIYKVNPSGKISVFAQGLTTVLGLVAGPRDRMYVLESMTAPGGPGPAQAGTGQIVRIDPNGRQTVIATGLTMPTGMTLGPDGALYVSNLGFAGPGAGQIVRIPIQ